MTFEEWNKENQMKIKALDDALLLLNQLLDSYLLASYPKFGL